MPPALGVIVSAIGLSVGFLTVKVELMLVVVTIAIPIIWEVPVARPTTVYANSLPFKVKTSWAASSILTWNDTWYVPISAKLKESSPLRVITAPLFGPSCGKLTSVPGATVAPVGPVGQVGPVTPIVEI